MRHLIIFLSIALLGNAGAAVSGLYTYTVNADNASVTITDYPTDATGAIEIPAIIDGRSVTSIGAAAFDGCSGLTSIIIPDSVTSIGGYVFENCTGLTSITIPNSVTSIGDGAFSNLTMSITIPDSVISIGSYAFSSCSGLTSITLPDSVTSLGQGAFAYCTNLALILLESMAAPTIESGAFDQISSTAVIYYPLGATGYAASYDGVPTQEAAAPTFGLYTYVVNADDVSVTITDYPETATGAIEIPAIIDGRSVTSIDHAFFNCTSLTSIIIPDSVTSIGEDAFALCSGLTSINIPDSVTSIGRYVFENCTGLTSVTIGNNVTSIGDYAFYACTGLTSITIPNSVTSIGDGAFFNCTGLSSVTIGNSVTSIGQQAFAYCTNLASIFFESMAAPTIESGAFDQISSTAVIYYPLGATGYAASYDGVPTEEAAAPPSDPESPVLDLGDFYESSAGVSVVVSAIPTAGYPTNFSYQWHFNNFAIPANSGGTAASYTIDGIPSNDGTWRVVVTNDAGSTEASFEYRVFADSDSDGLSDYRESNITNTNPSLADTDGDGLTDGDEVNTHNSSPIDSDSDDDTILDGIEVRHAAFGFDPAVDSSARLAELIALVEEFPGVSTDAQNNSLSLGGISLTPSGGNSLSVDFIIEESEDLSSWTTVDTVSHSLDTSDTKKFIRVRKP